MSAVARSQFLDYNFVRSSQFSGAEARVMMYVMTFSECCAPKSLEIMASQIGLSERHVRRAIDRLCMRGILKKTYRCFKRIRLQVVSMAEQRKLIGPGALTAMMRQVLRKKRLHSDRTSMSESDRTSVSEPIQKETLEKETKASEIKKFDSVGEMAPISELLAGFWQKRADAKRR